MLITLGVAFGMSCSAAAAELWVEPGKNQRGSEYENWATTSDGEAYFSFAVPADLSGPTSIAIVFVAKADKDMTYDLDLAVSRPDSLFSGNPQPVGPINSVTAQAEGIPSDGIVKDYIHELDLSGDMRVAASIGSVLDDLAGGDYLTIKFKSDPKGDVKIIGLRFRYNYNLSCEDTGTC